MPTVPRSTGPSVGTQALPNVRVGTNAPSAAFGVPAQLDLRGPTALIAQIQDEERQKADQVAVLDATNQLDTLHTDLSLAAQSRKGKDAMGALADVQSAWQQKTSQIEAGLTSDRQRQAFAQMKVNRWGSLYGAVESHAHNEAFKYDVEQSTAFLGNRLNEAIADPAAAPDAIAQGKAAITDFAKRNGLSSDQVTEKTGDFVSRVHVAVLNRYLATDQDQAARAYYDAHKDEVVGEAKATVEHALNVGTTLGESQRRSLAIVNANPRLADALSEVDKIADPEIQKATRAAVKERFAEREVQQREDYETLTDAAFKSLLTTGSVPAPIMAQLKPREIIAINNYRASLAKKQEPQTDWATYYKLRTAATSDDPQLRTQFQHANLLGFRHVLGDTEFKELVGMQTSVRGGKSDPSLDGYRTTDNIVNGALDALGLNPKKDQTRIELFRRAVDEDVRNWKQQHKQADIPSNEVQGIVDQLLIKSPDGSRFEHLSAKPDDVQNIDDVPLTEQRLIRQALFRAGNTSPSMEQITAVYRARLASLQAGLE